MKYIFPLISGLLLTSCSQFHTNRSYLSEMEQDDSSFFEPGSDFPVLSGDSGRTWRTDQELRDRTPASEYDLAQRREERALRDELRHLENAQSEHSMKLYEQHRHKFGNVSEKIYFLKLSNSERRDYLDSRGFLEREQSRFAGPTPHERLHSRGGNGRNVLLGMSKEDVRHSLGKPARVEVAGNPSNENERWVYLQNGAMKYIYFESGKVEGWE